MTRCKKFATGVFIVGLTHVGTLHASEPVVPWFQDSFESAELSDAAALDGSSWEWGTSRSSIGPESGAAIDGTTAVEVPFGPDADGSDSFSELRFKFGRALSEVWIEYWVLYPENYQHRSQSGAVNNKFLQLNYNGSTSQMLTIESERQDGWSKMRRFLSTSKNPDGSNNWTMSDKESPNFIGPSDEFAIQLGKWTRVRLHYRAGTDGIQNDGLARLWIGDELYHSLEWPFWEPKYQGKVNGGYFFGWSNSGFSDKTTIRIDGVRVYDTPPGWGHEPRPPLNVQVVD